MLEAARIAAMLPTGPGTPTAPIGDFNNVIVPFMHARPLELIFGIPVVLLLVIAAITLAAMVRRSRQSR